MGLCDNCALKYADCKGNKDLEKCHCDYYKKPVVMNVKELAERVAELEFKLKLKDSVEVVRCKDCRHRIHDEERGLYYCEMYYGQGSVLDENYCQWGERRMTREEAIKILKQIQRLYGGLYATSKLKETYDAFDMAIEALSANYTTEKPNDVVAEPTDLISREDAIEAI